MQTIKEYLKEHSERELVHVILDTTLMQDPDSDISRWKEKKIRRLKQSGIEIEVSNKGEVNMNDFNEDELKEMIILIRIAPDSEVALKVLKECIKKHIGLEEKCKHSKDEFYHGGIYKIKTCPKCMAVLKDEKEGKFYKEIKKVRKEKQTEGNSMEILSEEELNVLTDSLNKSGGDEELNHGDTEQKLVEEEDYLAQAEMYREKLKDEMRKSDGIFWGAYVNQMDINYKKAIKQAVEKERARHGCSANKYPDKQLND